MLRRFVKIKRLLVVAAAAAIGLWGSAAHATFTFMLGGSNLGGGFTGPFAQVAVTATTTTSASITFTSLTNGGFLYLLGGQGAAGLNVNGVFSATALATGPGGAGFTAPT